MVSRNIPPDLNTRFSSINDTYEPAIALFNNEQNTFPHYSVLRTGLQRTLVASHTVLSCDIVLCV